MIWGWKRTRDDDDGGKRGQAKKVRAAGPVFDPGSGPVMTPAFALYSAPAPSPFVPVLSQEISSSAAVATSAPSASTQAGPTPPTAAAAYGEARNEVSRTDGDQQSQQRQAIVAEGLGNRASYQPVRSTTATGGKKSRAWPATPAPPVRSPYNLRKRKA
ncbi:hypothetical protein N657DRAFT_681496 [Parathielavia appendiculata]|uniref:Uncharacterized protein n=1 Tax=Parathielavia appendiculata TaxID=2587402 RepID=A0AAN6TZY8_9PEZI|nr:hypothetical protein N657DRAFT_681496 [Parathielavia appendiculata]